jgi:hypothetical protein
MSRAPGDQTGHRAQAEDEQRNTKCSCHDDLPRVVNGFVA